MYDKNPHENGGFVSNLTAVDLLNSGFAYPIYKSFLLLLPLAIRAESDVNFAENPAHPDNQIGIFSGCFCASSNVSFDTQFS